MKGEDFSMKELDSKSYEEAVKFLIEKRLVPWDNGKPIKVYHRQKYHGLASGHEHEIDLSFEVDVAGTQILVVVECKCYRRRISVDDVLEFSARIDDISAHKGILVSTVGFQKGAAKVAKAKGIALVIANAPELIIAARYCGYVPPVYSSKFFHLSSAQIERGGKGLFLQLSPVDETNYGRINPIGEQRQITENWPIFLEIVETGIDKPLPNGRIQIQGGFS